VTRTSFPAWTALFYIAALALFLRFFDLALKPLHHDEAVNTLFVTELVRPPHAYKYDPGNYHGPTLFYFGWLSVSLFGMRPGSHAAGDADAAPAGDPAARDRGPQHEGHRQAPRCQREDG
jgi:hypothetical protein